MLVNGIGIKINNNYSSACAAPVMSSRRTVAVSFCGDNETDQDALEARRAIQKLKEDPNSLPILGSGWKGTFYQMDEKTGIKVPCPRDPNQWGADIAGHLNIKEHFALKTVNKISLDIAPKPHALLGIEGKNYLSMDLIKGSCPWKVPYNKQQLEDVVKKTFTLDTNGILHYDLQSGNIIIDSPQSVKFIDFGSFGILNNNGDYISSDDISHVQFENGTIHNQTKAPAGEKFAKTFSIWACQNRDFGNDFGNFSDNSYLNIKSSMSNFELRSIYDYILKGKTGNNPLEFFKSYLQAKSKFYHTGMIEFLRSLDDKTPRIQQAIEQEEVFREVFANPSENVIKAEADKIKLKWLLFNYEKMGKNILNTYEKFTHSLMENKESAVGHERKYFENMLKIFRDSFPVKRFNNPTPLAPEKDIVKILYANIPPVGEAASAAVKTADKFNAKPLVIGISAAALAAAAYVVVANKLKQNQPQTQVLSKVA